MAGLHHVELWLDERSSSWGSWAWLFDALGFECVHEWSGGQTWKGDDRGYLTLTTSPNLLPEQFDRRRGGVNHLAFVADARADVDSIMTAAAAQGWQPLYHERYPHAGGDDHYAGWLENTDGFKVEIVAP